MIRCKIKFNNPEKIFKTGHFVKGSAFIEVDQPLDYEQLSASLRGKTQIKFKYSKKLVEGHQHFYDVKLPLYNNARLGSGISKVNFSIPLPPQLPSSYADENGLIVYHVIFEVKPMVGRPEKAKEVVTVVKNLDFIANPEFPATFESLLMRTNCLCCVRHPGSIIMRVTFNRSAYLAGSRLDYKIEVSNEKKRTKVKTIKLSLESIIYYHANEYYPFPTLVSRSVCRVFKSNFLVLPEKSKTLEGEIKIPKHIPSTHRRGILRFRYFLKIMLRCSVFTNPYEVAVPIIIGNEYVAPAEEEEGCRQIKLRV